MRHEAKTSLFFLLPFDSKRPGQADRSTLGRGDLVLFHFLFFLFLDESELVPIFLDFV